MKIKKKFILSLMLTIVIFTFFSSTLKNKLIKSDKDVRTSAKIMVNIIQENYNNGDFFKIYNTGTDDFKKLTPENDFFLLMKRKKEVLGDFVSSTLMVSNVINSNVVILTYRSTYENYSLIEEFQFIRKDKKNELQLGTYFIDDGGKKVK
jgi:hypothetical protein